MMKRSLFISMICTATLLLVGTFINNQFHASPILAALIQRQNQDITPTSSDDGACGFDGNPDMYGLGIRIGVYVQAAATVIATSYRRETGRELVKVGGLFQFAALVALIQETVNNKKLYAVEALVTYLFCLTSTSINMAEPIRTVKNEKAQNLLENATLPSLVSILRQTTGLGIGCYQTWFWFTGLDKLERAPCKTETFFLARVNVYGRFRTFAKIWSVYVITTVTYNICSRLRDAIRLKKGELGDSTTRLPTQETEEIKTCSEGLAYVWKRFCRGSNNNDPDSSRGSQVVAGGIVIGMIVLAVELTIQWNNVRGVHDVNSVGQLIPLIIGIGTFIGMVLNWDKKEKEEEKGKEGKEGHS